MSGLQPSGACVAPDLGLRPRLFCSGPLALNATATARANANATANAMANAMANANANAMANAAANERARGACAVWVRSGFLRYGGKGAASVEMMGFGLGESMFCANTPFMR